MTVFIIYHIYDDAMVVRSPQTGPQSQSAINNPKCNRYVLVWCGFVEENVIKKVNKMQAMMMLLATIVLLLTNSLCSGWETRGPSTPRSIAASTAQLLQANIKNILSTAALFSGASSVINAQVVKAADSTGGYIGKLEYMPALQGLDYGKVTNPAFFFKCNRHMYAYAWS